jgi:hypothetical protein
MVARARRVAGFGSGKVLARVGVRCRARGPGAASAHPAFADVLKRVEISTVIHKCAQDSHGLALEWHASSEMLRD